ncbi:MAG: L-seryl-tRNA(Sec) selenium transferase, partial [Alphaproteobacteria bacterium]|nr:L-seryl-tRNA(Sec) selenium transferase [Alphaproteobacteria bacterium]
VDRLLQTPTAERLIAAHGRDAVVGAVRTVLEDLRARLSDSEGAGEGADTSAHAILTKAQAIVEILARPSLKPVINLTGTVLHTNLGRAQLPDAAIEAMTAVAGAPANLEFDLGTGRRGDRDVHVDALLCELTGCQAATAVNNNAAAVLLALNSLANRREVPVSRGELIEIGGSFRIPDIMKRAGAKLVEVGTTNRTHLSDFEEALSERTALVMKVHTSNYVVEGFTAAASEKDLADLAHANDLPFMVDLGSGTLADFAKLGLPPEPTPADAIAAGADLVTFSGDKLLGGPQAGLIVGRADLIAKIKRNPMKRALRLDKVTLAALGAVLRLYRDPDRLADTVPTLRLLTRPVDAIAAIAARVAPAVTAAVDGVATVDIVDCNSQIGSGALPAENLPSKALRLTPVAAKKKGGGKALERLSAAFRALPVPVIGRIHDGAYWLDLRCLEDETQFADQIAELTLEPTP